MWHKVTDFFKAPVFIGDKEKTRRAKALNALQIYMGGIVLVFGFIGTLFIFEEKVVSTSTLIVGLLITLFGIFLNRKGRVSLASWIMLASFWAMGVFLLALSGGIQSQHIMIFMSGTVVAGIILGVRGGVHFAGASIFTALGFVVAEQTGYQFPNIFPLPPLSIWSLLVMCLTFIVIPLQVALQSLADSASRAVAIEERYRLIASVMYDYAFFVEFGPEGKISDQWVSGAFKSITGYRPEEYVAKGGWPAILHPDSRNQDEQDMEKLRANQKVVSEPSIIRKDGEIRWTQACAHPKWDEKNNRLVGVGIYGAVQDISERKQIEADRERLIAELEAKNQELENFTYTVSHDLKSPLVTINGFLGYLEEDAASGNMNRLKKDTQRIHEAVNKMQKLLSELLELSRIGMMMNPPEPISFEDVVQEALDIVQGRLNESGVTVHTQPNLPAIYGDKPRLIEVLQNLLDNAAKYMGDQSDPRIEIGSQGEDAERGMPIFCVKDNGIGIDPEHHERIFGLFNKLDAKSEGTGVGLALVKRIVEVHGGRIWVQSEASPQRGMQVKDPLFISRFLSDLEPDSVI